MGLEVKELFEIFSTAIEKERDAQKLYRHASEVAKDYPDLQKRFLEFEIDEKNHENFLVESYAKMKESL
jgi:rubrerythrin